MSNLLGHLGGQRQYGVLMHVSSLPGAGTNGCFGPAALEWIDLLAEHHVKVWQVLPLAPVDNTGSPYSSPSGFALNPQFLDPDQLEPEQEFDQDFHHWYGKQRHWLVDHCRFMVLRRRFAGAPWWEWPCSFASRHQGELRQLDLQEGKALSQEAWQQWQLEKQWQKLRRYSREHGVKLLGDLPFYGAHDSADVWSKPGLFSLNPDGSLAQQSGVPPDYFSSTGQLWSTPVYRWSRHRLNGYRWWLRRLQRQLELFDLLRLDHFRAFAGFWSVAGADQTAEHGEWLPSPGKVILKKLSRRCGGSLPLVAEDLGVITSDVDALRLQFDLPGMKVLQFAFDADSSNAYLPQNFANGSWVVYTGTHDNATARGWWRDQSTEVKQQLQNLLGHSVEAPGWELLRLALASTADLAVVPLQDLMSLDNEARFNTPGTSSGNWSWRLDQPIANLKGHFEGLQHLGNIYGRGRSSG
jgi:4-alpha-glucanotransferase